MILVITVNTDINGLLIKNLSVSNGLCNTSRAVLYMIVFVAVVQLLCCVRLFATLWTAARQAPLSFTVSGRLLRFMSVELVDINLTCPTISSSATPFSFYLQSFPAPGSFPTSWFFESGGQSTGVSASTSVLPMDI